MFSVSNVFAVKASRWLSFLKFESDNSFVRDLDNVSLHISQSSVGADVAAASVDLTTHFNFVKLHEIDAASLSLNKFK